MNTVPSMSYFLVAGFESSQNPAGKLASMLLEAKEGSEGEVIGVLASFWYYRSFDMTLVDERCPLILDSGAFSAYTTGGTVDLEDYAKWVAEMPRTYDFAFTLDVLGDPGQSLANWRRLRELGIDTVPVIHYGAKAREILPAYLNDPNPPARIALGGLAGTSAAPQAVAWAAHAFAWLRDNSPETQVHGLGVPLKSNLAVLPWSSTDSSSYSTAWRFARASVWNPATSRWVTIMLDGRSVFKHGKLLRMYGVEPEHIAVSTGETRDTLVRLIIRSEVRAVQDFNRRHSMRRQYMAESSSGDLLMEVEELATVAFNSEENTA